MDSELFLDHENAGRILEEGWQMFQQKGYRGVTIDELCLRCGLSKPTLYYYFQDKENLFVQILQHKLKGFREAIEQPGTLEERLQGFAALVLESFQNGYSALERDHQHLKDPHNLEKLREAFRSQLFGPLMALMQAGVEAGTLQPESPQTLGLIFLGMLNNFTGKSAEMNLSTPALAQKLVRYFLQGAQKS